MNSPTPLWGKQSDWELSRLTWPLLTSRHLERWFRKYLVWVSCIQQLLCQKGNIFIWSINAGWKHDQGTCPGGFLLLLGFGRLRPTEPRVKHFPPADAVDHRFYHRPPQSIHQQPRGLGAFFSYSSQIFLWLISSMRSLIVALTQASVLNNSVNTLLKITVTAACAVAVVAMLVFIRKNWN